MHVSANLSHLIKQKSYEHVVYVLRRDLITLVPKIIILCILALIPIALFFMFQALVPDAFLSDSFLVFAVLLGSGYYASILLFFYTQFIIFYLDMWVVTNDRIIDVEQLGLFSRTISELDLFRIQDVTTEVDGIFPTMFNYGTLTIKTASDNIHIVFRNIPNPNKIREDLIRLSHEDRKFHLAVDEDDE